MIKKIFPSQFDLHNLSLKRVVPAIQNKTDYKSVVVDKPWGYEYLMYENNQVAIWILFLKHLAKTSMHCHPRKKTSLLVLSGKVNTSSLDSHFKLGSMEGIIIDRGVFHSTSAVSEPGAFIMEIETPPQKDDLVRLKDEYGRENQGYEGLDKMFKNVKDYEYNDFHEPKPEERKIIEKIISQSKITLHHNETWENLFTEIQNKPTCVMSFIDTKVFYNNEKIFLDIGEICLAKDFLVKYKELKNITGKFNLLTIH
jgi:mannose-6-phosphate isomerase-like protein (cupin superfamily)